MLAMADAQGYVGASVPGLASVARIPMDDCIAALKSFSEPDKWSRTKDNDGRRIAEVDGGWILLNHEKYREIRSSESRREQNRLAQQRYRDKQKVSNSKQSKPESAQAEAEAEADKRTRDVAKATSSDIPYEKITQAYNREMVKLSSVRLISDKRKRAIKAAWCASKDFQTIGFWDRYFEECADDKFLNGTGPYGNGHANWKPDFDYLIRVEVVQRTYEKAMAGQPLPQQGNLV